MTIKELKDWAIKKRKTLENVDDLWFADNNEIKQDWFLQQALAILDNIDEVEVKVK
jgi:hypothetical protein